MNEMMYWDAKTKYGIIIRGPLAGCFIKSGEKGGGGKQKEKTISVFQNGIWGELLTVDKTINPVSVLNGLLRSIPRE